MTRLEAVVFGECRMPAVIGCPIGAKLLDAPCPFCPDIHQHGAGTGVRRAPCQPGEFWLIDPRSSKRRTAGQLTTEEAAHVLATYLTRFDDVQGVHLPSHSLVADYLWLTRAAAGTVLRAVPLFVGPLTRRTGPCLWCAGVKTGAR